MPVYKMQCRQCGDRSEVYASITVGPPERCPQCAADEAAGYTQRWMESGVTVWTYGQDKITTVGQQAEYNEKKLGKELTQKMWEDSATKKEGPCPYANLPGVTCGVPVAAKAPWWRDGSVAGLPKKDKPVDVSRLSEEGVERYIREGKT